MGEGRERAGGGCKPYPREAFRLPLPWYRDPDTSVPRFRRMSTHMVVGYAHIRTVTREHPYRNAHISTMIPAPPSTTRRAHQYEKATRIHKSAGLTDQGVNLWGGSNPSVSFAACGQSAVSVPGMA
eukprot:1762274-Rhodomonas_salina.1